VHSTHRADVLLGRHSAPDDCVIGMQGLHNSRAVIGPKLAGDVEKALRLESTGDRNDRAAGGDTEARVDCIDDDIGVIPDGTRSSVSKSTETPISSTAEAVHHVAVLVPLASSRIRCMVSKQNVPELCRRDHPVTAVVDRDSNDIILRIRTLLGCTTLEQRLAHHFGPHLRTGACERKHSSSTVGEQPKTLEGFLQTDETANPTAEAHATRLLITLSG
jgi:hypothetical protein